jgi:signal transduction histidine kinase
MRTASLDQTSLRQLLHAGRGLVEELDLDAVLDRMLQTAQELTGARYAALGVVEEERSELERVTARELDDRGPRPSAGDDGPPPLRGFVEAPIRIRGDTWGTLSLTCKQDGPFTAADEELLVMLADWAAVAIDNAHLHEREAARRRELERAVAALEASAAIARAVDGETDAERIIELVAERGRALVEARALLVLLREGERLTVAAAAGGCVERAIGRSVAVHRSAAGRMLARRSPLLVADAKRRSQLSTALGVRGVRSALVVPLVDRGRELGVLVGFDRVVRGPAFHLDDERLAVGFASGAAAAVAAAQRAEQERVRHSVESAERERCRWARELHDATLQSLGALRLGLTSARRADDRAVLDVAVDYAIEHLGEELTHLRALITDLRPAALDDSGVPAALAGLVARATALHDLRVSLDVDLDFEAGRSETRLAPEIATAIYRTVQEALTNVCKHAGATRADIEVRERDGVIAISVADDGRGFDPAAAAGGFGIVGMRERAALAHGRMEIRSSPAGTTVTSLLPSGAPARGRLRSFAP